MKRRLFSPGEIIAHCEHFDIDVPGFANGTLKRRRILTDLDLGVASIQVNGGTLERGDIKLVDGVGIDLVDAPDGTITVTNTGVGSIGAVGAAPNANAGTITSGVLNLQPASSSFPGLITTGTQTLAGNKTLTGTIAASNLSGVNTGDVTLASVGATPNANGASLTGQVLNLQPASSTLPGVVTELTQTLGGAKTFTETITGQKNLTLPATSATAGTISLGSLKIRGVAGTFPNSINLFAGNNVGNTSLTGEYNLGLGGYNHSQSMTTASENILLNCEDGFIGPIDANENFYAGIADGHAEHGNGNIVISHGTGGQAISAWVGTEAGNIYLGSVGASESSVVRIGEDQTKLYSKPIFQVPRNLANDYRVYCGVGGETHVLENQNEEILVALVGQTTVKSAGGAILQLGAMSLATTNGWSVSANTLNLTRKGWYHFKVVLTLDVGSQVYCQMKIGGVQSDSETKMVIPFPGGFEQNVAFGFKRWLPTDIATAVTFYVAADTYPVAGGAQPVISAGGLGGVIVTMIN